VSLKLPEYCLGCLTANLIRCTKGVIFLEILTNPASKLIVPYLDSTLYPNSTHNVGKHASITVTVRVSHTMSGHPPSSPINPLKNACINNLHFSHGLYTLNRLTPNDPYMGRTASLTSKLCILYIYSTNIDTEYFKYALYSPFFSLQNAVCFIMLTCLFPVLFTFYIQTVLKLKK
jgi:hypothetical protein